MKEQFYRSSLLLGEEGIRRLGQAHVLLFGVGGVGSFVAEALVRTGLGALTLVDMDMIEESNLNRQLQTLQENLGRPKAEVMGERLLSVNPQLRLTVRHCMYLPENRDAFFPGPGYDYVADCIDTVTAKIDLAATCYHAGIPLISAMGAGNKLDPSAFRTGDLFETSGDPLARVLRRELRKRGIPSLKVVWSPEPPIPVSRPADYTGKLVGSVAFCPSVAGLIMAGEIIRDLSGVRDRKG